MSTATHGRPAPGPLLDLPGQAHVAEGPLDLNGMYLAHHAFRRDLNRFAAAARNTPVGAADVWRALAVRWGQFSDVLHHHHTTEDDVLWPQLLDVVDAAAATCDALTPHLRHEETEALPLVQALLPAAGWERVEQAAGSGQSPLKLVFLVPWAADALSPAQLETVLASLGGAFRVLLRLTRRPYERREREAFRYA